MFMRVSAGTRDAKRKLKDIGGERELNKFINADFGQLSGTVSNVDTFFTYVNVKSQGGLETFAGKLNDTDKMKNFLNAIEKQAKSLSTKKTGLFYRLIYQNINQKIKSNNNWNNEVGTLKRFEKELRKFLLAKNGQDIEETEAPRGLEKLTDEERKDKENRRKHNSNVIEKLKSGRLSNVLKVFMALVLWDYMTQKIKELNRSTQSLVNSTTKNATVVQEPKPEPEPEPEPEPKPKPEPKPNLETNKQAKSEQLGINYITVSEGGESFIAATTKNELSDREKREVPNWPQEGQAYQAGRLTYTFGENDYVRILDNTLKILLNIKSDSYNNAKKEIADPGVILESDIYGLARLNNIRVSDLYRRKGVGKSLINKMKDELHDKYLVFLHIESDTREAAERLYKSMGFRHFADNTDYMVYIPKNAKCYNNLKSKLK